VSWIGYHPVLPTVLTTGACGRCASESRAPQKP
jgi:hypothetical protein